MMDGDILRHECPCFQFQRLGWSEKIPSVVVNSFGDLGLYYSRDLVCGLCCLGGSK